MNPLRELGDLVVRDVERLLQQSFPRQRTLGEPDALPRDDTFQGERTEPAGRARREDTVAPLKEAFGDPHRPTGMPVKGRLSSAYGKRLHPVLKKWKHHDGEDIAAKAGTPVHVTADGSVIAAGRAGTYGNLIAVDHGNGTVTRYAHLQSIAVKVGDEISRGDVIGAVGSTGRVTGPHLHYEVMHNGRFQNPRPFLQARAKQ